MKKTQQAIISIVSFIIILTFFAVPVLAQDSDGDGVDDVFDNCPTVVNSDQMDGDNDGVGDACECQIIWWTDDADCDDCDWDFYWWEWRCWSCAAYEPSGSAFTLETSRTQAAAAEVYSNILFENPNWTGTCYNYYEEYSSGMYDLLYDEYNECLDGSWSYYRSGLDEARKFLDESNGGWDVTCGDEDLDRDSIPNGTDNCPSIFNPDQSDADNDGIGDACDSCPNDSLNDADGDGLCGGVDNCPEEPNPDQTDADSDGIGNICDVCPDNVINDVDEDGVCSDNCPTVFNPDQADSDGDGIGDICEDCNIVWWTDEFHCISCVYTGYGGLGGYDCWQCTFEPSGSTETLEISRTQATALEVFENIMGFSTSSWTGSCYSYDYHNEDYSVCLDGTWHHNEYGEFMDQQSAGGGWDVVCGDSDGDGVGDAVDPDTIFGTISGGIQEAITVNIFRSSCGGDILVDTAITDAEGYYSFGGLNVNSYMVRPILDDYSFIPEFSIVQIPQSVIQPFNFTSTLLDMDNDGVTDSNDNCPNDANPDQVDCDLDGIGDVCDDPNPICDGLAAYYPFNGNADDGSGNNNNGTVNGAVLTTDRNGNTDSACMFDGVNDYIAVDNDTSLDMGIAASFSVWVKPDKYDSSILMKWEWGAEDKVLTINSTGNISFNLFYFNNGPLISNTAVPLDEWTHIAAYYDGSEDVSEARLYINGVLDASQSASGDVWDSTDELYIGNKTPERSAWGDIPYGGIMDELRIYNRALSEAEILELYNE